MSEVDLIVVGYRFNVFVGEKLSETCPFNTTCDDQDSTSTNMQGWIVVFILAQLLHGFGSTPLYTIGFAFLEESTDRYLRHMTVVV